MLETRPPIRVKFKGWGSALNVDWKLTDNLSLKSITAYREYDSFFSNDNDLSPLASSLGFGDLDFHSFSQELRLNGAALEDDRLEYTVGAFYWTRRSIYATTQDLRYSPRRSPSSRATIRSMRTPWPSSASVVPHHRPADDRTWACATRTSTRTTRSRAAPTPARCTRRSVPSTGSASDYDGNKSTTA